MLDEELHASGPVLLQRRPSVGLHSQELEHPLYPVDKRTRGQPAHLPTGFGSCAVAALVLEPSCVRPCTFVIPREQYRVSGNKLLAGILLGKERGRGPILSSPLRKCGSLHRRSLRQKHEGPGS